MKNVLVLNFFPAFTPPASGGELRYFYMYKNLSSYFDVTLLSPTYNGATVELITHSDTFKEYRIPKEDIHNQIHWKLEEENFSPEFSALTCAYSADYLNEYHKHYLQLYTNADIIIHDFPYMLNYDLFFGMDNKPRIYNSHNLEYDLLCQIYTTSNAQKHLEYILELEKKLVTESQLVFATSNIEKNKFQELYKIDASKIKLAPNGINPEDFLKRDDKIKRKTAFFIGSGHPPNTQAVEFIVNELASKCPDITFLVAGTCCGAIQSSQNNVKLLGKVDEKQKNELFQTSEIAINPMFSGAGTNLKSLEFLSMGIPMISTDVGVRGLEIQDREHFILADRENFAQKLNALVEDTPLKEKISKQSKEYINEQFNWKQITQNIYKEIKKIEQKKKKTLLLLNDFEVSQPFGGGEIRINKLYSQLSKSYSIVLLCFNNDDNISKINITKDFLQLSFPKTKEHKKEELTINLQYFVSATDIVNSYMISKNELFMSAVNALAPIFDITILCHPYMYEALSGTQCNYLIHESLNHELSLKKELLSSHPSKEMLLDHVTHVEASSCNQSHLIISVSHDDHKELRAYLTDQSKEIVTIKNGVDIVEEEMFNKEFSLTKSMFKGHTVVVFIGSAHMPNIDSAKYIISDLAPQCSDCYFIIIGSVCESLYFVQKPSNVLMFGKLERDYKNVLCSIADIAINPMLGGSGSNLKLAEYFSWKLPTITTPFGARGYDITNNHEAIICDIDHFPHNIAKLQTDIFLAKKISDNAFNYVKSTIEWSILGKQYRDILDLKVYGLKRKKLLVITYRLTTPPLGGAEVYMYELLKGLDTLDDFDITVAALDPYDITNQYHFSIHATHDENSLTYNFKNITVKRFVYDELNDRQKYENSILLMNDWIGEFLISARKYIDKYQKTLLLGGWNFPEKSDNTTQIWSSSVSEIYIQKVKKLFIKGFSPSKKSVRFKMNGHVIESKELNGSFDIEVSLKDDGIFAIECDAQHIHQDIRPLGLLIYSIITDSKSLSLSYSYRDFLKENYLSLYIDELIETASKRDKKIDSIFQQTRGLNSRELENYIDENAHSFDILLGHSIPFATTPITSKYALKHNKPYALLPHFHFDDEFYHWKSYYEPMQKADLVFASPTVSIETFYDKLKIKTFEIPGGGIDKSEYNGIDTNPFLQLYKSDKPYFLVLGRKTGAKNYQSIIDAIEKVNRTEHICNLVMIGRNEDGIAINSKYTYYLGEQSREVVLGALKNCYALVTMSQSESFGIVIVEAWMLKKPVIINAECPAFVELVKDKENGLHTNISNLKQNIESLLKDKDLANKLGENGYTVVDDYTWQEIAKKINTRLLKLCN